MRKARALFLLAAAALGLLATDVANAGLPMLDDARAALARRSIIELDVKTAHAILDGADDAETSVALERARLAIYDGNYDQAVAILSRPDLAALPAGAELTSVARGAARGMAATLRVEDEERGVVVGLQDDDDRALVPFIAEVAARAREVLAKELGVELPRPIRIELVRDQFTLAAMTGLPLEAAQTTGTVAVAKWGRVTMLSPRSMSRGYPWLDTLVHELTHLAITQGTRDKAPLWLQEGVAKRQEIRWREGEPFDDVPSADAVAADGIKRGLGVAIDKMGPSIAMLPSAEQATIAFAEVTSFIRFWTREAGDEALPQLLLRLKEASDPNDIDGAIKEVSVDDFATWDKRWRAYLDASAQELPPEPAASGAAAHAQELTRRFRLGELLFDRKHYKEAAIEQARAQLLAPTEAHLRCGLVRSLLGAGDRASAAPFVERVEDIDSRVGRWWSLHGWLHPDPVDPDRAFRLGIALDPLDPGVACEEKVAPELPSDALRKALCEAARRAPR